MWLLKMRFLGNFNGLGKSFFLMISDKSRLQNCIFNKGAKDSEKMAPECDAFFCHNQIQFLFLSLTITYLVLHALGYK